MEKVFITADFLQKRSAEPFLVDYVQSFFDGEVELFEFFFHAKSLGEDLWVSWLLDQPEFKQAFIKM